MALKKWMSAALVVGCVSLTAGVLGAAAAPPSRSCPSAGDFTSIRVRGVTCRYATKTFFPTFRRRGKVLPRGWKCSYKRGSVVAATCRRSNATIAWKGARSGGAPGTTEYRVYADFEVALPAGAKYTLTTFDDKCVNDRLHGEFTTKSSDEKSVLWMDASESVIPACFSLISYVRWVFHVSSPFTGDQMIYLGQGVNGGPYSTGCESWYKNSLHCEKTKQLGLKISGG